MPTPSQLLPEADRDLLRILCCVAWSDGDFAAEEKQLLQRLVATYFLPEVDPLSAADTAEALADEAMQMEGIEELVQRLQTEADRQLALKLAFMMIRVSTSPGDASSINPMERVAYRRLVEALGLGEAKVQECEWAAEQELRQHSGLRGILASRFEWLGAWPSQELLETPGMQWL
ncbi:MULTISPECIES: TerB family tellurite resistance protein [unclassified Synechococcus]|uniref:tellurite resistance TerB family protein n=1 Tax=unclassified Synechococcus TaxID=2626047 RepID=UPI0018CDD139|nr:MULTISPECIES: TerB family tellurite resistance protein [unclassified Synechococcus]MEA5422280.1 TerB family tellurite resistance protein [Synechococcus sp. CCY9202]QPN65514.1 TerB family tellurite resistance protein [Synechococcus sp. CBW1006]CAK6698919.1 hypothetical protein IFHNHDMJ_02530 [Synechococcus sp. CBW1107]